MTRSTRATPLLLSSAIALAVGGAVTGCPRSPPVPDPLPPKPRAPPVAQVPPGCEVDLSGEYTYEGHPDWRYMAVDDGGMLALTLRRYHPDAGPLAAQQDGGVAIRLERTPKGFVGGVEYSTFAGPGGRCPVRFGTAVLECGDGGIRLESVDAVALDPACQPLQPDGGVWRREHRLIAVTPSPLPASGTAGPGSPGTEDAGAEAGTPPGGDAAIGADAGA